MVVDIGHGRFAFSTHFQPNSLKVKSGRQGPPRPGARPPRLQRKHCRPHLHFSILDGPGPFSSNSLPFVFSSFTTTGTIANSFDEIQAGAPAEIGPARAGPHRNELPLQDEVITFPKQ